MPSVKRVLVSSVAFFSATALIFAGDFIDCKVKQHACVNQVQVIKKSCHETQVKSSVTFTNQQDCQCNAHMQAAAALAVVQEKASQVYQPVLHIARVHCPVLANLKYETRGRAVDSDFRTHSRPLHIQFSKLIQ